MSIATVTINLTDALNNPLAGASVVIDLAHAGIDPVDGLIAPARVTVTLDDNGAGSIDLWASEVDPAANYQITVIDNGAIIRVGTLDVPVAGCELATETDWTDADQILPLRFPYPVYTREDDLIERVADTMHLNTPLPAAQEARIRRWINYTLHDINHRRAWWWLQANAATQIQAGQDVIDLTGHIDRVRGIWAPGRLRQVSLSKILEVRHRAQSDGAPNAGTPAVYALEAGRRVHLWPAPDAAIIFSALYQRPMNAALLPEEWLGIVHDGVIGRHARHWDRDAIVDDPLHFETRYERGLKAAASESWDVAHSETCVPSSDDAQITLTPDSLFSFARGFTMPVSTEGVGSAHIECGCYPLIVP